MNSKRLKYTLLTAILLAVVLLVSVVPVATAKTDTAAKPVDGAAVDRMIEKLEPLVTRCDDGTFRLDIPAKAKINTTSREFKAILAGMNSVNELIRQGELVTTPDLTVYSVDDSQFVLQDGINLYKARWYGFEIWISHEGCQNLRAATGSASIFSGAALALFPNIYVKIASGVLFVLFTVNYYIIETHDDGCGVHLKFLSGVPIPFNHMSQSC
jgi:hypothetical protein